MSDKLTSAHLCSFIPSHLPISPCPSPQGHLFVLGLSQVHPWLRASVFIVASARNIPSLDIFMADSFSFWCLGLSSAGNFLSPALSLSSILSCIIYSTCHSLKKNLLIYFLLTVCLSIRMWAPYKPGSSVLTSAVPSPPPPPPQVFLAHRRH